MKKVVNLREERLRRDHAAGHAAHEAGLAFSFRPYKPGPSDDDLGVGWIEAELPVCVLFSFEDNRGLCMSRETAARLGAALLEISKKEPPSEDETP